MKPFLLSLIPRKRSVLLIVGLLGLVVALLTTASTVLAVGFNGHNPTTNIGYTDGNHARTYTAAPNMRQSGSSLAAARSEIRHNEQADVYVNFTFNTSGDSVYLVYTTDNSIPTKTNGNVVSAAFSKDYAFGGEQNRTWYATIPGHVAGARVQYVFYISNDTLANGYARVTPDGGYETSWTEGDREGFRYIVSTIIDSFFGNRNVQVTCDDDSEADPPFPQSTAQHQNHQTAMGGQRDFLLQCVNVAQFGNGDIVVTNATGTLSFSQGANVYIVGRVVWDGQDNSGATITYNGLGGADLTAGGINTAIHMIIRNSDLGIPVRLRIYSGSVNDYRQIAFTIPDGIPGGSNVSLILPFNDFTTEGNGAFNNVGAVELLFDGTNDPDADLTITLLEATNEIYDWGDLPNTYGTTEAANGPRHLRVNTLRLGASVDVEADGQPSAKADADDYDDGVWPSVGVNWQNGPDGGSLRVIVNGCVGTCRLNGWIDWFGDGDFDEPDTQIFNELAVTNGTTDLVFDIPPDVFDGISAPPSMAARFRICTNTLNCNTPYGAAADGEVEDYDWEFGPTAVTLQSFNIGANNNGMAVGLVAALAAALLITILVMTRRQITIGRE